MLWKIWQICRFQYLGSVWREDQVLRKRGIQTDPGILALVREKTSIHGSLGVMLFLLSEPRALQNPVRKQGPYAYYPHIVAKYTIAHHCIALKMHVTTLLRICNTQAIQQPAVSLHSYRITLDHHHNRNQPRAQWRAQWLRWGDCGGTLGQVVTVVAYGGHTG